MAKGVTKTASNKIFSRLKTYKRSNIHASGIRIPM
jgi:hypothetical protein